MEINRTIRSILKSWNTPFVCFAVSICFLYDTIRNLEIRLPGSSIYRVLEGGFSALRHLSDSEYVFCIPEVLLCSYATSYHLYNLRH